MLSVEEAVARVSAAFKRRACESVPIHEASGRVLGEDAAAKTDQPPASMSAMDGYALRAEDVDATPKDFVVIGEAPAGSPYVGTVSKNEAVRIFTGGVVPHGADCIVIQEDTEKSDNKVLIKEAPRPGQHVRLRGLDFSNGETLLRKGHRLSARDIALLAAADFATLNVITKPRIGLVATGDELSRPGTTRGPGGIVASSTYALAAFSEKWGGTALDLGILPDNVEAFAALPAATNDVDLIVTQGGASVGDHDLVQRALKPLGFELDFWKIAMRPGKPLIFGRLNDTPLLGLPGNPVSAMVCAILFLRPAIAAMLGMEYVPTMTKARLSTALNANGARQNYIRTQITSREGVLTAEPFALQDSAMQKIFARSDGLIVRAPAAPAVAAGAEVDVLMLDEC
jgi:molybdopterin molybdotransferase